MGSTIRLSAATQVKLLQGCLEQLLDWTVSDDSLRQQLHELEITLEWLPVWSPELNAIEDIWGDAKEVVCANHQLPDIETQADAFLNYIEHHTNHQAQRKAGLLRENYGLFQ